MAQHSIGIMGFGKIAQDQHAPAISASPDFELVRRLPADSAATPAEGFGIFDAGIDALSIRTRILPQPVFIHAAELFFPAMARRRSWRTSPSTPGYRGTPN